MIKTALTLALIGGLCALALVATQRLTADDIDANRQAKARALLKLLATGPLSDHIDAEAPITGRCPEVFLRDHAPGYAGDIHVLARWHHDDEQLSLRVTRHRETPGIGDFIDHERSSWLPNLDQSPPDAWQALDAVSGATITSQAITTLARRVMATGRGTAAMSNPGVISSAALTNNPAWVQMLGLCPLLAVSSTVTNALGLAAASAGVVIGSNTLISLLRHQIPDTARLPCFVLIIATFTTIVTLLLEAYAFGLYEKIALFVQIIVTNCMILGRAERFASRQPLLPAIADGIGTGLGFAVALLALGAVREVLAYGTLLRDAHLLFGEPARQWTVHITEVSVLPLAAMPPGAFIIAGLLLAAGQAIMLRRKRDTTHINIVTEDS